VKVYGVEAEAPVKVINGAVALLQTAIVPEMVAVGNGFTIIVALPVCVCEQAVALPSCTLTSEYIYVPTTFVDAATVTLFPLVVVINWLAPPLIL